MKALLLYLFAFTFFIGAQANMETATMDVINIGASVQTNSTHQQSVQSTPVPSKSDTLFEIEKDEEEEKAKWLLPAIYAVCLNVFPFSIKTEQRKICNAHHISTSMPRYLVLNVFRI